jgi:hypothetical protein
MLPLHAGRDRHLASRQFFLISTLRQRSRHFRLGQQRAPFTVEALESAAGNTGNTDNYLAPPNHFQPTVRPMNETGNLQRKGRKGRNPPTTIRRPRFINDIGHFAAPCTALSAPVRRTVAWRKPADTPCTNFSSGNCPQFCCLTHGVQSTSKPVAEIAENAEIAGGPGRPFSHRPPSPSIPTGVLGLEHGKIEGTGRRCGQERQW